MDNLVLLVEIDLNHFFEQILPDHFQESFLLEEEGGWSCAIWQSQGVTAAQVYKLQV